MCARRGMFSDENKWSRNAKKKNRKTNAPLVHGSSPQRMRSDNQKFTGGHGRFDAEPYLTAEQKKRPGLQSFS